MLKHVTSMMIALVMLALHNSSNAMKPNDEIIDSYKIIRHHKPVQCTIIRHANSAFECRYSSPQGQAAPQEAPPIRTPSNAIDSLEKSALSSGSMPAIASQTDWTRIFNNQKIVVLILAYLGIEILRNSK